MIDFIYDKTLGADEARFCLESTKADLEYQRLQFAFEACDQNAMYYESMAELKVYEESGTYDDLGNLYQEAEEEVAEKKQGIISRIIEAIMTKINSILEFIKGKKGKVDPESETEVAPEAMTIGSKIKSVWAKVKNLVMKLLSKQVGIIESAFNGDFKGIATELGVIATSIGAIVGGKVVVKKFKCKDVEAKGDEVDAVAKDAKGVLGKIKAAIANAKSDEGFKTVLNKVLNKIKEIIDHIQKLASHLLAKAKETVGRAADSVKNKFGKKDSDESKEDKPEDSNEDEAPAEEESKDEKTEESVFETIDDILLALD